MRVAALATPRINADGELTFVARALGQGLPRELPGFSINVARASTGGKSVTRAAWDNAIAFDPFDLDSTASIQATVSSNNTATVTWPAASGYTNACRVPITLPGASGLKVNLQGFTCGDLAINSKVVDTLVTSFVQMIPSAGSTTSGCGFVVGCVGIAPPASTGKSSSNFNAAFATWGGTGGGGSTTTTNCSWAGYWGHGVDGQALGRRGGSRRSSVLQASESLRLSTTVATAASHASCHLAASGPFLGAPR